MKISKREIIFFIFSFISFVLAIIFFFLHQNEISCYYLIGSIVLSQAGDIYQLKHKYNELEKFLDKYKEADYARWEKLLTLLKDSVNNKNK